MAIGAILVDKYYLTKGVVGFSLVGDDRTNKDRVCRFLDYIFVYTFEDATCKDMLNV